MLKKLLYIGLVMVTLTTKTGATEYKTELKILSWNVFLLPYISLFNDNGHRSMLISEKLKDSDYDIIVFQEAFSRKCRNIIGKNLKQSFPYQYGPANKTNFTYRTNSGLWIISKIQLCELGQIEFKNSKGFDAIAKKGAVLFEGIYNGANFQLLTTHLQADGLDTIRTEQCREISQKLLNPNYKNNTPQFICGDFNIDISDQHNYEIMLQTLDAKNGEISGALNVTYDEVQNNLAFKKNGKKKLIDYVLVRNETKTEKIERTVKTFFTTVSGKTSHLSDHYAMEFCVSFASMGN